MTTRRTVSIITLILQVGICIRMCVELSDYLKWMEYVDKETSLILMIVSCVIAVGVLSLGPKLYAKADVNKIKKKTKRSLISCSVGFFVLLFLPSDLVAEGICKIFYDGIFSGFVERYIGGLYEIFKENYLIALAMVVVKDIIILATTKNQGNDYGQSPLRQEIPFSEEQRNFCMQCGARLDESAIFCPMCGKPLKGMAKPSSEG